LLENLAAQAVIGMENACKRGGLGGRGEPRGESGANLIFGLSVPNALTRRALPKSRETCI